MHFLKRFLGDEMSHIQKLRLTISVVAVLLMFVLTALQQSTYSHRPLQVAELSGKQVSMEKLADVFIAMDVRAQLDHYHRLWTQMGIIFLGAVLILKSLRDEKKR